MDVGWTKSTTKTKQGDCLVDHEIQKFVVVTLHLTMFVHLFFVMVTHLFVGKGKEGKTIYFSTLHESDFLNKYINIYLVIHRARW